MDTERAGNVTHDLVALVTNTHSHFRLEGFPGMDVLGLDPDDEADKAVADAIYSLVSAGGVWAVCGRDSAHFGRVQAMLEYGVTTERAIRDALQRHYAFGHHAFGEGVNNMADRSEIFHQAVTPTPGDCMTKDQAQAYGLDWLLCPEQGWTFAEVYRGWGGTDESFLKALTDRAFHDHPEMLIEEMYEVGIPLDALQRVVREWRECEHKRLFQAAIDDVRG